MKTKDEIRNESYRRLSIIEQAYGNLYHLPSRVISLYRLYSLLAEASIKKYIASFGYMPIDVVEATDAKVELGFGNDLTEFEREVIKLINNVCREFEKGHSELRQTEVQR